MGCCAKSPEETGTSEHHKKEFTVNGTIDGDGDAGVVGMYPLERLGMECKGEGGKEVLPAFAVHKYQAGATVIVEVGGLMLHAPIVAEGQVATAAETLGRTGITRWAEDEVAEKCLHKGIFREATGSGSFIIS